MREFKFRAWIQKANIGEGFMLYPNDKETDYFIVGNGDGFGAVHDEDWLNSDDYKIMQCTGLKDKNGKEIYEGDILKISEQNIGIVDYRISTCSFCLMSKIGEYQTDHLFGADEFAEVIGNIYENSELI